MTPIDFKLLVSTVKAIRIIDNPHPNWNSPAREMFKHGFLVEIEGEDLVLDPIRPVGCGQ